MSKSLVVVESPTKAKTLGRFLPDSFQILASYGHIRDLPTKRLGILVSQNFQPQYEYLEDKKKVITSLISAAKKADEIILATDPDREGEAIASHLDYLFHDKLKKVPQIKRITFHEITPEAIKKALAHPGKIDENLVQAQQARRLLDRLVGYKLSPLLWYKVRRGLSAGRVQSVVVRLIYEREKEIEAFKPEEYWQLQAQFLRNKESLDKFELVKVNAKKIKIGSKAELEKLLTWLEKSKYKISALKRKKVTTHPLPPLITSALQQAASIEYGFNASRTMRAAQSLYEKGLITYHRTDSFNLAESAIKEMRQFIKKTYGEEYLPPRPNVYRRKSKLAQEAHEAIRPTKIKVEPQSAPIQSLSRDEKKIYELIWRRSLASQMADWQGERLVVEIEGVGEGNNALFRRRGVRTLFPGWRQLSRDEKEDKELPFFSHLKEEESVSLEKLLPEQKFTSPPKRYTDASLIKKLEEMGIGRPSTYAPILSKIQERRYVEKEEKKFKLTNLGKAVTEFLLRYFPKIMDYNFTAKMEDGLDAIAQGKEKWLKLLSSFWKWFKPLLDEVKTKAERVKIEVEKIGEKCPKCGGELVIRIGKYGKFISCSNYPKCDYTREYVEKTGLKCPECGGEVIIRKTKKGRRYYACSNYPSCKWMSWRKPK